MNEKELDKIESDLLKEDQKRKKQPMPVSGRGVFILKRIIENKANKE